MIPFVALLPVLGSAFRLLAGGGKVDPSLWGTEVTNVLSALTAESSQTNEALTRIEEKLDDLTLQPFRHSFGAALNLIEEATPEWREPGDRDSLIVEARNRLNDALATNPDPISRATVEWYLGVAWLLLRSTRDCERAMSRAADTCLAAMVGIVQVWNLAPGSPQVQENARALEDSGDRLHTWLFGGPGSAEAMTTATLQVRRGLAPYAEDLEATLRGIQETRRTLGADPVDCPPARFGPPVDDALGSGPKLIVDVSEDHVARLWQVEVGVGGFKVLPDSPAEFKWTLVDAELLLACSPGAAPVEFRIALLDEQQVRPPWVLAASTTDNTRPYVGVDLRVAENQETELLTEVEAAVGAFVALPGPSLLASGGYHPAESVVQLQAGQTTRGWLRFACSGKPAAIVVTPPGDSSLSLEPVHFLRSL